MTLSAYAKWKNRQKIVARLAKLPKAVTDALEPALKTEVDDLVEAQKRAAPVDEETRDNDQHLRDSIHAYKNPDRVISYRILADAKDEQGRFIGSHVEQGHRAVNGAHVQARPSFFPTYRARKKGMQRRVKAAGRKAAKAAFPGDGNAK